jgi:sulfate adenylyltransferase
MANRQLHIDQEALETLSLLKEGLLSPVNKLMNKKEAEEVDKNKTYKGTTFPFSLILAPSGNKNRKVLTSIEVGEVLDIICDGKKQGSIKADEVFKIDKDERIKLIYGTSNPEHKGVRSTYKRLGDYAIAGDFDIDFKDIIEHKNLITEAIESTNAKSISSIMLSGKPFHRVHERIIRTALVKNDLIVIFLLKPIKEDDLAYTTRYNAIKYFCDNYLPKDKFVLVPFENTYIFGGFNELILNAIVASNYGCNELIIGKDRVGLGAFYEENHFSSILDTMEGIDININIMSNFVYCDKCSTLVSTNACPHGSHHHISYHNESIMELFEMGILPPAILVRREISSIILCDMFPERSKKLARIHQQLSPNSGILDDFDTSDFYEKLMRLYQTSSLT